MLLSQLPWHDAGVIANASVQCHQSFLLLYRKPSHSHTCTPCLQTSDPIIEDGSVMVATCAALNKQLIITKMSSDYSVD